MRLMIIGSLDGQIGAASKIAMQRGAKVAHVPDLDAGLTALRSGQGADLVMMDATLDVGGFIRSLDQERISIPVVACGVGTDASIAVSAIKAGAKEYIPLPPEPELIAAVLQAVTEETKTMVFRDDAMAKVIRLADQVAPSDASILITGESGTGKEVMARYLHSKSARAGKPFISINCAAIPENLLESELFGHEKGAFTGAATRRVGKFEEANGGTLLLDEISEMDTRLQAKLLRAVQEREIDRVGGSKPVSVDIRVLATSNRNLLEEVKKGNFREDLLFRLNVVSLELPPLRDRPMDLEALSQHFIEKYSEANGVALRPLASTTQQAIRSYGWPGNVRELENTMHRAVLLANGPEIEIDAIMLPDGSKPGDHAGATDSPSAIPMEDTTGQIQDSAALMGASSLVGRTVADVERDLIINTLTHCLGNRTHAATILGISIRTLRNKLKLYSDDGTAVPAPGEHNAAPA
ncbi:MAG: sigma-54-dependent Fis family transcriptional regulator [Alphaproteobacteria bacterium]|jgi:two-component system, response regulator FlrC|nr:sigma-54-dependent Fis family transcriptional regulator [Alphaproteobacteria bacterium]MBT4965460.1 sigma-54-dependent Fis family transcriptional regulator [Alphaproteobacteria bacterium]MBT5918794.1 sigma-54-dependent Fis family transcriptional regulator [Alphaproteobacteria bacterium]